MPIFTELRGNAWWYLNSFDMTRYGDMWMARTRRNAALGEAFDALNAKFDEMARFSPVALTPSLDAVNEYSSSLTTLIKDYALQVLVGVKNLDEYDSFVSEWKGNGGDAMGTSAKRYGPPAAFQTGRIDFGALARGKKPSTHFLTKERIVIK